jgi:hypothetical protein
MKPDRAMTVSFYWEVTQWVNGISSADNFGRLKLQLDGHNGIGTAI